MLDLYVAGMSPLHRLAPIWKVLGLLLAGTLMFATDRVSISAGLACLTLALYALAGLGHQHILRQLRSVFWVFVLILLAQIAFNTWQMGLFVILRFAVLILLAGLLTLTTRSSEIIEGLEVGLSPLARLGLRTDRISLAISLTLRFIPVLATVVQEVREAQKTRGLERNLIAVAIPALIRTLRMSEEISDAIDARGY